MVAQVRYYISYSCSALQLKTFCLKNGIPTLAMHLGRRQGASVIVDVGIDRMNIKWLEIGQWIVVIFIFWSETSGSEIHCVFNERMIKYSG